MTEQSLPGRESEGLPEYYGLQPGEQVLWQHVFKKGLLHRKVVEEWLITNKRALKRFPVSKGNPQPRVVWVGLEAGDVVVMNERRQSSGVRVGNFVGAYAGGGFEGASVGNSMSRSTTFGDLVFFVEGTEHLRFNGVSDPAGVRQMIETVKKEIRKSPGESSGGPLKQRTT